MTRVVMWAGRLGPGRASAGALVEPEGADRETVRRAVLACGVALAADRLAAAGEPGRETVVRAFGASAPEDLVDLTGRCEIGGLAVPPAEVAPPPGAAVADLLLEPGDDPDDAEPLILPGSIDPAEAAALSAAAIARALPRDPLHLARAGVALRTLAREAAVYPETLTQVAAGVAATARNPDDVRLFSGPGPDQPDQARGWTVPDPREVGIALGATLIAGAIGVGVAAGLLALFDSSTANRTTALVVGGIIGAVVGCVVALRLMRR